MKIEEKIALIDQILPKLFDENGMLTDFLGSPKSNVEDKKYRIIENELIELGLVKKLGGGDNSTPSGFIRFMIEPKGSELIIQKKSVKSLYDDEIEALKLEKELKNYQLKELKYKETIRDQEQEIRDLKQKVLKFQILKNYWWLLGIFGYGIGKLIEALIPYLKM